MASQIVELRLPRPRLRHALLVGLCVSLLSLALRASGEDRIESLAHRFFPHAERIGAFEGNPPAAPVFEAQRLLGYLFFTDEVVAIPAYSGKPIRVLVGIDTEGRVAGAEIIEHSEPILVTGVSEEDLAGFVAQYHGLDASHDIRMGGGGSNDIDIDGLTGATITAMVLNASISRAARIVAAARGLPLAAGEARAAEQAEAEAEHGAQAERAEAAEHAGADGRAAATAAPAGAQPLWVEPWRSGGFRIAVLILGLVVLTVILVLQDWLTRYRALVQYLRTGFLLYTLIFIGWYGLAQLSVVNVLTFTNALTHDFRWETFLIDPMIFILWSFVAVTLLLWGRGVFCGWLCPYGALQELVNKLARRLHLPQLEIHPLVHERLLAIKYVILLVLFGLSLQSMADAVLYAEVEPFKTAINLHFQREWPFVLYAAAFVIISSFNSKLFCKYVCPLGAALTIPGKFRIFDWLRRRKECGHPCQVCAVECPSQAIRPTGEINANECHYCLDCQLTYWDAYKCPPLVEKRKRFEKHGRKLKLHI